MKVVDFLAQAAVIPALTGVSKASVLAEMSKHLAEQQPGIDANELLRSIEDREALASTAIGDGIAIPHAKIPSAAHLVGVIARSAEGLPFDSLDGKPTHIVCMLAAPNDAASVHLEALARLSRLFRDGAFRQRLLACPDGPAMYRAIQEEDAKY
jgi:PTS system nitrogen regulatory IIA component